MRDLTLITVFFLILPFVFRRPWLGVLLLAWLGYMNPHRLCYSFAYEFPFYKITAIVTIFSALISGQRYRVPWTTNTILLLIFTLWLCFTTNFALNPLAGFKLDKTIKTQIVIFITLALMQDRKNIHRMVWVIGLSLAFYGVKGGVFAILTGGGNRVLGPEDSFIEDNNAIALALAMTIPLLRFLQLNSPYRLVRLGLSATMGLCALAVLSTYSRGGFVALSVTISYLILKSRRRVLFGTAALMTGLLVVSFMPAQWAERMHTIKSYEEDGSAVGRLNAWYFAMNLAADYPITGGGFDVFTPELFRKYAPMPEEYHAAHSIYFEVLGEQGYIGLALFLMLAASTWFTSRWIKKATRGNSELRWAEDLASTLQASLLAYAVGGAFLGLAYFDLPYHLLSLLVVTQTVIRRMQAADIPDSGEVASAQYQEASSPAVGWAQLAET